MVAQNTTLYGPASLLTALEQTAAEEGFAVSVGSVRNLDHRSISAAAVERHLAHRVAGIVVIAPVRVGRRGVGVACPRTSRWSPSTATRADRCRW